MPATPAGTSRPPPIAWGRLARSRTAGACALLVCGLVAVTVLAVVAAPAGAADCVVGCGTVTTEPGGYVGSLLLPPSSAPRPAGLSELAAHCDGCIWTLEPACPRLVAGVMCPGAAAMCPPTRLWMALYLQRPLDPTSRRVGTFCRDPALPLQPVGLLPGVMDRFSKLVPGLHPSFQPASRGLVNLPVVLATGQPPRLGRLRFDLAGHVIGLSATASWDWDLGDGTRRHTERPGGPWPDMDVTHAFASPGRYEVSVTTTWVGQFWVDGAGPFLVGGPILTQSGTMLVPIVQAAAVLD
jgi:PKD domain